MDVLQHFFFDIFSLFPGKSKKNVYNLKNRFDDGVVHL